MEPPDLEIMCIEIDFGKKKWAIISVYRQATKQTPKIFLRGWVSVSRKSQTTMIILS